MAAAHGTQDFGLRMPAPDCAFVPGEGAARLPVVATRIQIGRPSIPRKFLGFPTWSRKCDEWQSIDAIGTIANNNNNINNNNNAVLDSIRGSIFGLLVPFCSCGALPLAVALKQEGVSPSSIAAFVTAAQAAGVDSLFFTYGVFGARVALFRMVAAGMLAFLVGMTLATTTNNSSSSSNNTTEDRRPSSTDSKEHKTPSDDKGACCKNHNDDDDDKANGECPDESSTTAANGNANANKNTPVISIASLTLFAHTAVELFASVSVWVFLGVVVSASAAIWAPPTSAATSAPASSVTFLSADGNLLSVMKSFAIRGVLFLLTIPMTICEHGIVSLADALRGVGFSVGTAVALVVTGPSTNAGTLLMLSRLNNGNGNGNTNSSPANSSSSNSSSNSNSNWIADVIKITAVVVAFGVSLSYLADDLGSTIVMTTSEKATSSGGGSALPGWLNEHALSIAGVFTFASILQSSSLFFHSLSPSSSSCSG